VPSELREQIVAIEDGLSAESYDAAYLMDETAEASPNWDLFQADLAEVANRYGVQNVSVSVCHGGVRQSFSTSPSSDAPIKYGIGCIARAVMAATALQLDEDGVLDIESPVERYLQEFRDSSVGRGVRVRHLLSDSTGLVGFPFFGDFLAEMTWDGVCGQLMGSPQLFSPGTVCSTDHANPVLLGEIVCRTTGRPWTEIVDERVGMPIFQRSLYGEKDRDRLWAAAAASTKLTADELALFAEVLMNGRASAGAPGVLSERTVTRLRSSAVVNPERIGEKHRHWLPVGQGLGLSRFHSELSGECGKGKGQLSSFRFNARRGIALSTCVDSRNFFLRNAVLDMALSCLGMPVPPTPHGVPMNVSADELTGEYTGLRGFKISVAVDRPRVTISVQEEYATRTAKYECRLNDDGSLSIERDQLVVGLAFFADPADGTPCLLLGLHPLKKVS
jgi:CubicO group peptidase (beta-lactamase class C family)